MKTTRESAPHTAWRTRVLGTALTLAAGSMLLACSPGPGGEGDPVVGVGVGADDEAAERETALREPASPGDGAEQDGSQAAAQEAAGGPASPDGRASREDVVARANLRPTEGNSANGLVQLRELPEGGLTIRLEVAGLEPGPHGLHIHTIGDCSAPDASSAGDHYAPEAMQHGGPSMAEHHAGDLGNIEADETGIAVADIVAEDLTLTGARSAGGRHPVESRAVIVHQAGDDFMTQPDGNSGNPVACGVVEKTA